MHKQKGFSLFELLIVIAVILAIAAAAIPSFQKARIAANQASAVGSLHAILAANVTYQSTFGGFAPSLAALGGTPAVCGATNAAPAINASCLIDPVLSDASTAENAKSGYFFIYTGSMESANGTFQSFNVSAIPAVENTTGDLAYYADQSTWEINPMVPVDNAPASSLKVEEKPKPEGKL